MIGLARCQGVIVAHRDVNGGETVFLRGITAKCAGVGMDLSRGVACGAAARVAWALFRLLAFGQGLGFMGALRFTARRLAGAKGREH